MIEGERERAKGCCEKKTYAWEQINPYIQSHKICIGKLNIPGII